MLNKFDKRIEKGRPLPKFGDWDVNNPASAEGFTVIFNKARDEKKTGKNPVPITPKAKETQNPYNNQNDQRNRTDFPPKKKCE
ncbi:RIN4, pathogenic type III effector avirulence factor Avr cleavage site [Dillenia turbinata]|uniref:RIN4, pathogenic type III effector avirulence factor Avr cleavage site n=1 Tax=Dillenia turbinata TaxID=194707 RepID=A0AAN8ZEL4_9MAGN